MGSCKTNEVGGGEEQPGEKLLANGHAALSDGELLSILLRSGLLGTNARELGQQLLKRYGSLGGLSRCSVEELSKIKGLGYARAMHLAAAFGLASRLSVESVRRERIDSPERVFQLLGMEMRALTKESLRVVLLDTRYQLMRVEEISRGTVNESIAHPRDIFCPVFTAAAYAFILVHNHPSGDPAPSEADRRLTTRLSEAARLLQVQLLDHVILGTADNGRAPWFSFKQTGLI
ncbi:MAG: DNA repair protein RadC [Verrucomicrobiota bacterium]